MPRNTLGHAVTSRKKNSGYRFGKHTLAKLEERIAKCKSKLADPDDPDDKRWLARWLRAAEQRLTKKERSLDAKAESK